MIIIINEQLFGNACCCLLCGFNQAESTPTLVGMTKMRSITDLSSSQTILRGPECNNYTQFAQINACNCSCIDHDR